MTACMLYVFCRMSNAECLVIVFWLIYKATQASGSNVHPHPRDAHDNT